MRIAVIPARGGSKRIPRKNIKLFCGKPMIAWSIEAAKASGCFDRIFVSTDDDEIKKISIEYGAEVPFSRPASLADDFTGTNDVIVHAIQQVEKIYGSVSIVACIYPTAPFLEPGKIAEAIKIVHENDVMDYAVTVTKYPFPIQRALYKDGAGFLQLREFQYAMSRSQDLEEFYHDAGQLYCGRPSSFINYKTVFESKVTPIFLSPHRVQDIDTPDDWNRAEIIFKLLNQSSDG